MKRFAIAIALGLAVSTPGPVGDAVAGDKDNRSTSERHHDRAHILRERATANARAQLGYSDVYGPITEDDPDRYYALSLQIEHLAGILEGMRRSEADRQPQPSGFLPSLPLIPGEQAGVDVRSVYGPDGPTEASVRLMLEYRLLVAGNPRLTVGQVKDSGTSVTAQVVTRDGSLVEEYAVDKNTGVWRPVR